METRFTIWTTGIALGRGLCFLGKIGICIIEKDVIFPFSEGTLALTLSLDFLLTEGRRIVLEFVCFWGVIIDFKGFFEVFLLVWLFSFERGF